MSEKIQMPGDPDEAGEKTSQVLGENAPKRRGLRKGGDPTDKSPEDAVHTQDELDKAQDVTKRGPNSPAQHDDDGWGDVPVQMRG